MKDKTKEIGDVAQPNRGIKRVIGKFMQLLARKLPFIPGKFRVFLQCAHGVKFIDAKSTFLGEDVFFDDIHPELITIGKNVRITAGVRVLTHFFDTKFTPTPDRPFRFYTGEVVIGDNVFIGVNTVIAKPVVIGNGAVIGANSVVSKDIPENAIAVGTPAKVIGYRPLMQKNN